jgi:hypothetical protein
MLNRHECKGIANVQDEACKKFLRYAVKELLSRMPNFLLRKKRKKKYNRSNVYFIGKGGRIVWYLKLTVKKKVLVSMKCNTP